MELGLGKKVALVCGASSGLGRAAALELAREGARVVVCSRSERTLEAARADIALTTRAETLAIAADLSEPDQVDRLVDQTLERFGRIDILVTNTGGPPAGPFEAHDRDTWSRAIRQNLESVINLCRAALPSMKQNGWGRIINITSISVKQPVDGLILSNSLRAGVTGFARTLANEVAAEGITVNNVLPGYTDTAPKVRELKNCHFWLKRQLDQTNPLLIVTIGRVAYESVMRFKKQWPDPSGRKFLGLVGQVIRSTSPWVYPLSHTSRLGRASRSAELQKEDWLAIPRILNEAKNAT